MLAYYQRQEKQGAKKSLINNVFKEEKVNTQFKKERGAHPTVGFSFLDDKPKGGFSDFGNVRSMTELTVGFLNSTQIIFGGSRTECQFST